jgi:hypothetical protein
MEKSKINFWLDMAVFIDFVGVIFTGVLLHRFPPETKENLILGINRYDWGDLHWVLCLALITLTIAHLVLHWSWIKVNFGKYLKVGPKAVVGAVMVIVFFLGIFAPVYLTKDLPDRKRFKDTYPETLSREVEERADLSDY